MWWYSQLLMHCVCVCTCVCDIERYDVAHVTHRGSNMKSMWDKTVNGLSSISRGTYNVLTLKRLRTSQSSETGKLPDERRCSDRELGSLTERTSSQTHAVDGSTCSSPESSLRHSLYGYSPALEPFSVSDEDSVLYRKNNVCLKCQLGEMKKAEVSAPAPTPASPAIRSLRALHASSSASLHPRSSAHSSHSQTSQKPSTKVPGFLFIASRGSNFGSTLILNWTPNSAMINHVRTINNSTIQSEWRASDSEMSSSIESKCSCSSDNTTTSSTEPPTLTLISPSPQSSSPGSSILPPLASPTCISASPSLPPLPTSPLPSGEHQCVSLDLSEMEVIRVFYRRDESGHIVSGEMVVSSKQTNFWVFQFSNGGLTDLIRLFASFKYFSHHHYK